MASIDEHTPMPTDDVIRANLFGNTPRLQERTKVPESPDIITMMANLREELEAKYSKEIQDLNDLLKNLLNGPPNLNAATKYDKKRRHVEANRF